MAQQQIQPGDFVRLISPEDFLCGEEGQAKEKSPTGRWRVSLGGMTVYRHESELLVVASNQE